MEQQDVKSGHTLDERDKLKIEEFKKMVKSLRDLK